MQAQGNSTSKRFKMSKLRVWFDVKHEVPLDDHHVLVYTKQGNFAIARWRVNEYWMWQQVSWPDEITHWCELEAPKNEPIT